MPAALFDAFWRAATWCLRPRVIALSLLPLALAGALSLLLGWLYWERALDAVRAGLEQWALVEALLRWVESVLGPAVRGLIVPLLVVALALPVLLLTCLLLVAVLMTPLLTRWVAAQRFPGLSCRAQGAWWRGALEGVGWTLATLLALALTLPLWLIPPLALVIPPLLWGLLTARLFTLDVLSVHATREERLALMRAHRWPLLLMGVLAGLLAGVPGVVWAAVMPVALPLAPLLAPVVVWAYTLVFAFTALWFVHYLLAALALRRRAGCGDNRAP
ncbi:MAG TPA: EI24 domain-containing protein [Burkholderiaceae bacterium]|nr:EI24 domain-containing protein [Burkholderiaceae bacterium]